MEKICTAIKNMKRVKIKYRQKGKRITESNAFGYDRKQAQIKSFPGFWIATVVTPQDGTYFL